jgi:hypothetical protein
MFGLLSQDFDKVSGPHVPTDEDAGEDPFPGHDTVSSLIEDGTPGMADLADLADNEESLPQSQAGSYGNRNQIDSRGRNVLGEIAGPDIKAQGLHFIDALDGQQADLAVTESGMSVACETDLLQKGPAPGRFLAHAFERTDVDRHDRTSLTR